MEFTKEQIEYLKKKWDKEASPLAVKEWFDSLLKPKRKKIVAEIEYDADKITFEMNDHAIRNILNCGCSDEKVNWKVTELPEVFTREDMIEFAKYFMNHQHLVGRIMETWLSERNKK